MNLEIDQLEKSFAGISTKLDEVTMMFYSDLFTKHPETKPLFDGVDLMLQRRKIAAMLTLIVTNLRRMDVLVSALRSLGAGHIAYGATPESYRWFEQSLLRAIEQVAGDAWDEATAEAWTAAIGVVSIEMMAGATKGEEAAATVDDDQEDIELLMEIASNPALSFRKDSLFTSYMDKKKSDHEISLARTVQRSLIPAGFPELDSYRFSASYEPAMLIGGDYYDWVMIDDENLCLVFGDVSGKGIPGALIMCRLAGAARALLDLEHDPTLALTAINKNMCDRMPSGRFITLALLNLNLKSHRYTLVNAGHLPPILRKPDGVAEMIGTESGGIPIGITKDTAYQGFEGEFNAGDSLVFYTDGVNEAMSPDGHLFGMDRLCSVISSATSDAAIGETLLEDVRRFSRGRPQSDDVTILTITRT